MEMTHEQVLQKMAQIERDLLANYHGPPVKAQMRAAHLGLQEVDRRFRIDAARERYPVGMVFRATFFSEPYTREVEVMRHLVADDIVAVKIREVETCEDFGFWDIAVLETTWAKTTALPPSAARHGKAKGAQTIV